MRERRDALSVLQVSVRHLAGGSLLGSAHEWYNGKSRLQYFCKLLAFLTWLMTVHEVGSASRSMIGRQLFRARCSRRRLVIGDSQEREDRFKNLLISRQGHLLERRLTLDDTACIMERAPVGITPVDALSWQRNLCSNVGGAKCATEAAVPSSEASKHLLDHARLRNLWLRAGTYP